VPSRQTAAYGSRLSLRSAGTTREWGLVLPDLTPFGGFPRYALGVLSPLVGTDTMPYGLYRLLGPDFIVIATSLALQSFAAQDLERAVAAIEPQMEHLVSRGAHLILQSGTPMALSLGPDGLQRMLARLRNKAGRPVLSSALNAVAAAQAVGARRLAVANKWNDDLNRKLAAFFAHWGIEIIGAAARSQEPAHFQSADLRQSAELAYALGREALAQVSDADALFIGGGAWFAEPAAERLEREFGKPVITHLNGAVRGILQALDCWRPFPAGHGRVLETA
jgi:maleate cis-trans isomerase